MGDCNTKCAYCESNPITENSQHSYSMCQSQSTCTCQCCVGGGHDVAQKTATITTGVGLTIGGILAVVFTAGAAAPLVGAIAAGAGVSVAANGITKTVKGEKMDAADLAIDTSVGAISGAVGAGGAAGSVMRKVTEEGVKMTVKQTVKHVAFKTTVMAATGVATSAMSESANCYVKPLKEGSEEREFNPHCLWVGGVVGGLGAAGSSISKGAANKIADNVASKAVGATTSASKPLLNVSKRGVVKVTTRICGESVTGTAKGAVVAAGKLAAGKDKNFDYNELWSTAAQGAVSSICSEATSKLNAKDKTTSLKSSTGSRAEQSLTKNSGSNLETKDIDRAKATTTSSAATASRPTTKIKISTRIRNTIKNPGFRRNCVRVTSAVVETTANEGILQAKQAVTGKTDETRHFGKNYSVSLLKTISQKLGRHSTKHNTRRNRQKKRNLKDK